MRRIAVITALLLTLTTPVFGQSGVAVSLRSGANDPDSCTESGLNVFLNRTTNLVKYCDAGSWVSLATSVAPSFTGQVNFSDGTAAEPSWGWTSDDDGTGTGMFRGCANCLSFVTNGVERWIINASGSFVPIADNTYDIGNGTVDPRDINAARNLIIGGTSAITGNAGFGGVAPSVTVGELILAKVDADQANLIKVQNADTVGTASTAVFSAGTNVSVITINAHGNGRVVSRWGETLGGWLEVLANPNTGEGFALGTLTARPLKLGVNAQTRDFLSGDAKTLTESTETAVINITISASTVIGGTFRYTIEANDASAYQSLRGSVDFSAVNEGGTETCTLGTPVEVETSPTGTLTNTVTCTTAGTNTITLNLNAVSSLAQTTLRASYRVMVDSNGSSSTGNATVVP